MRLTIIGIAIAVSLFVVWKIGAFVWLHGGTSNAASVALVSQIALSPEEAQLEALTGTLYQTAAQPLTSSRATAQPSQTLATAVQDRSNLMSTYARTDPELFFKYALPGGVRARLPASLQSQVENAVSLTGTVEVLHSDDFTNEQNSKFDYYLTVGNQMFDLYPVGEMPALISGTTLSVTGYELGNELVTTGGPAAIVPSHAPKPDSVGQQRVLVIPVMATGSIPPVTSAALNDRIFNGPFAQFYKEQSYGKVWFTGKTLNWIAIPPYSPSYCYGGSSFPIDFTIPAIQSYILANGIDLSQYDRIVFVGANMYGGCAMVGKNPISFNGHTYQLSEGWVGYSVATSTSDPLYGFDDTLSHEMGHELGVMHANAWQCAGPSLASNCVHVEYGNYFDVMGVGDYGNDFNAFYKDMLGWLPSASKISITQSGIYSLAPLESANGVRAAIVSSPLIQSNGLPGFMYLEYREPLGFDSILPPNLSGILINYPINPYGQTMYAFPHIVNANYSTDFSPVWDWKQPALVPGGSFYDDRYGVTLSSIHLSNQEATFKATITPPSCIRLGMTAQDLDFTDTLIAGSSGIWYSEVTNNNYPACGSATLVATSTISDSGGWIVGTYPTNSFVLNPEEAQYVTASYYVPSDTPSGTHTLTTTLVDSSSGQSYTFTRTIHVIQQPTLEPDIALFNAVPTTIPIGAASELSWSASNATQCFLNLPDLPINLIDFPLYFQNYDVVPTTSTAYQLVCANASGNGQTAWATSTVTVTVTALPPPTCSATTSPATISSGRTAKLIWTSTNAAASTFSYKSSGILVVKVIQANGTLAVSPDQSKNYLFTFSNSAGVQQNCSVAVTVSK